MVRDRLRARAEAAGLEGLLLLAPGNVAYATGWHFSVNDLGRVLGIEVKQPFLDEAFVRFALDISPELKVKGSIGKYILRQSFEGLVPQEIVWREKEPIEYGSGFTKLREIITNMVSEAEFQSMKEKTGIKFINKEHYFYYRIYSEVVGEIPRPTTDETGCPCCGAQLNKNKLHCGVCGYSRPLEDYL